LTKHCDLVIWVSLVSFLVQLSQPRQKNSQKFSRLKSTIRSSRADSTFVPCQKPQDQKCQPQVAYSQLSQARLIPDTRTPVIVGLAASKFGVLCPECPLESWRCAEQRRSACLESNRCNRVTHPPNTTTALLDPESLKTFASSTPTARIRRGPSPIIPFLSLVLFSVKYYI
jgi:hypothetical protein